MLVDEATRLLRRSQRILAAVIGVLVMANFRTIPRELSAAGWLPAVGGALVAVTLVGVILLILDPSDRLPACLLVVLPIVMRRELSGLSNGAYSVSAVLGLWFAVASIARKRSEDGRLADLLWKAANWQVYVIYGSACLAKLRVPEWRNGTALRDYGTDPYFGFGPDFRGVLHELVTHSALGHVLTWSVLFVEAGLALAWLIPRQRRWPLVGAGIALHLGIAVLLGLGDFGLVMLAALSVISPEWPHRRQVSFGVPVPGES